ncbi:MAG: hypothetical protein ACPGC5_00035 [Flavobacteriaceae bacterium]
MKTLKLLSILFISTLVVSCSKDDDDSNQGRTTDPIIGSWRLDYDEDNSYLIIEFNSNGNYSGSYTDPDYPEDNEGVNGTWSNSGTDFTSTRQTYTTTFVNEDGESETVSYSAQFSPDFNSVYFGGDEDDTYIRQ